MIALQPSTRRLAQALLSASLVMPFTVQAQSPGTCKDVGFVDSVYQTGLGGSDYEYHVIVRNQGSMPMQWTLTFAGFPSNVTLFSPVLTGGTLQPFSSETLKFGRGTNGNISQSTVTVGYDTPPARRPSVTLSKCFR